MNTETNSNEGPSKTSRLRYRLAAGLVVVSATFGVFAASPASAHETHKYQYVYGNWDACAGTANVVEYNQYIDHGWGHQGRTEASIVKAGGCLRAKTDTWSDHWTNGYRQRVSFTIRDASGAILHTTTQNAFGVDGLWSSFHARTDYYVIALPQWVADQAVRIQINATRY